MKLTAIAFILASLVSSAHAAPLCWRSDNPVASSSLGYSPVICVSGTVGAFREGSRTGIARIASGAFVGDYPAVRQLRADGYYTVSATLSTVGAVFGCGYLPAKTLIWDFVTDAFGRMVFVGQMRVSTYGYAAACASLPTITQVATYYPY